MKPLVEGEHDNALKSAQTVIFDFSSPGCAPCRKVPGLLNEIVAELHDLDIQTYEINVSDSPDLARRYMVLSVPTLIVFRDGKETSRFSSLPKKSKLLAALS